MLACQLEDGLLDDEAPSTVSTMDERRERGEEGDGKAWWTEACAR
jgi:hypothetical protein